MVAHISSFSLTHSTSSPLPLLSVINKFFDLFINCLVWRQRSHWLGTRRHVDPDSPTTMVCTWFSLSPTQPNTVSDRSGAQLFTSQTAVVYSMWWRTAAATRLRFSSNRTSHSTDSTAGHLFFFYNQHAYKIFTNHKLCWPTTSGARPASKSRSGLSFGWIFFISSLKLLSRLCAIRATESPVKN